MKKIAYKEMYENEDSHAWYLSTRELMLSFLNSNLNDKAVILDAGCGTGGAILYMNSRHTGWNIYGIDSSETAIKYCRQRKLKNILKGDLNSLPYKNNFFDAVICLDVLYHQGVNPESAIKDFSRVLKKDGLLYLQEPAYQFLFSKHDRVIMTKHRFMKREIIQLVEKQFEVIKGTHFNSLLFPFVLIKRIIEKSKKDSINSDVKKLPWLVNFLALQILKVEIFFIRYLNFPFGLSVICLAKKK